MADARDVVCKDHPPQRVLDLPRTSDGVVAALGRDQVAKMVHRRRSSDSETPECWLHSALSNGGESKRFRRVSPVRISVLTVVVVDEIAFVEC